MATNPSSPDLTGLSHEQKDILILTLLVRLEALESKVNKNSNNSSPSFVRRPFQEDQFVARVLRQIARRSDWSQGQHTQKKPCSPPITSITSIIRYPGTATAVTMNCRCRMRSSLNAAKYSMCPSLCSTSLNTALWPCAASAGNCTPAPSRRA